MNCDAGHFENPGVQERLKSSGADMRGDDRHQGTRVRTEDAGPGPSQVGEDEAARDETMRSGPIEAWRSRGLGGDRLSR